jgi:hypothetical protein
MTDEIVQNGSIENNYERWDLGNLRNPIRLYIVNQTPRKLYNKAMSLFLE